MPTLRTFRIEFDRAGATYAPGETVSGIIIVDVSKEKQIRGLNLSAKGEANVSWTTKKTRKDANGRTHTQTEHYTSSENYFSFNYSILNRHGGDSRVTIPLGHHSYPFRFQLPHNIPCSFEHQLGHVRYTVKAVIDRPWKFDHECKAAFTVISTLDLNCHQQRCIGVEDEILESFCCFCCFDMGSLQARIRIPSSGYVPGQCINTIVNYTHNSRSVEITKICTKLKRSLKFHAQGATTITKTENTEVKTTKVPGPFSNTGQVTAQLQIPPIPPSHLEFCSIIDLDYELGVCIHVSGTHCKINKKYPILIGTTPLNITATAPTLPYVEQPIVQPTPSSAPYVQDGLRSPLMPMPMPMPVSPSAPYPPEQNEYPPAGFPRAPPPPGFSVTAPSRSNQSDMPPPSYEECMSGTQNIKEYNESNYVHGANEPFAPKYPVFNFLPPYMPK